MAKLEPKYLKGKIYYPFVKVPRHIETKKFTKDQWDVTLLLEGDELKKAKELGLQIREPNDFIPGHSVQFKRNTIKSDKETKQTPPRVIDSRGNDIPDSIRIGNDSLGVVKFLVYEATDEFNGAWLDTLQVRELVPYEVDEAFATGVDDNSFVVPDSSRNEGKVEQLSSKDDAPFDPDPNEDIDDPDAIDDVFGTDEPNILNAG